MPFFRFFPFPFLLNTNSFAYSQNNTIINEYLFDFFQFHFLSFIFLIFTCCLSLNISLWNFLNIVVYLTISQFLTLAMSGISLNASYGVHFIPMWDVFLDTFSIILSLDSNCPFLCFTVLLVLYKSRVQSFYYSHGIQNLSYYDLLLFHSTPA